MREKGSGGALQRLVDLVDKVGVYEFEGGPVELCGPLDTDAQRALGAAYIEACAALGRRPVWGAQPMRSGAREAA